MSGEELYYQYIQQYIKDILPVIYRQPLIISIFGTCQRSDLLSRSCFGTSRPRIVTKSKKIALFSQQMTRKCLPLVDGAGELKAEVTLLTAEGASAAAERLRHSCQKHTSSS